MLVSLVIGKQDVACLKNSAHLVFLLSALEGEMGC
jgi:hypothetical protein